jgi:hypothetical protein
VNAQTELPVNTDVVKVQFALTEFSKVDAGLSILSDKYKGVTFDVASTDGKAAAVEARRDLRERRLAIEKIRKEAKAPILALGKTLDAEATRITAAIEALENPIDAQIKAEEQRKEREKQERIAAEQKRVADIQTRIASIAALVLDSVGASVDDIENLIFRADAAAAGEFAEFAEQAKATHESTRAKLLTARAARAANDVEAARLAAERAEFERAKAEQAERDRLAAEQLARDRAEADRVAAEQKAESDRQARELQEAREALERDTAAQEALSAARTAAIAEQAAELERQKAAAAPVPSPPAPVPDEYQVFVPDVFEPNPPAVPKASDLIDAIASIWSVSAADALAWLRSIDWQAVDLDSRDA